PAPACHAAHPVLWRPGLAGPARRDRGVGLECGRHGCRAPNSPPEQETDAAQSISGWSTTHFPTYLAGPIDAPDPAVPVIRLWAEAAMTWDILIRGGFLIDGSGSPGALADIALAAGRIAAINPSLSGDARKVIDAEGLAVTPGFIDIKTHSDFVLPINAKAESKVRQGVTTEIIGHCGFSVAPLLPGKQQRLAGSL